MPFVKRTKELYVKLVTHFSEGLVYCYLSLKSSKILLGEVDCKKVCGSYLINIKLFEEVHRIMQVNAEMESF